MRQVDKYRMNVNYIFLNEEFVDDCQHFSLYSTTFSQCFIVLFPAMITLLIKRKTNGQIWDNEWSDHNGPESSPEVPKILHNAVTGRNEKLLLRIPSLFTIIEKSFLPQRTEENHSVITSIKNTPVTYRLKLLAQRIIFL